MSGIEHIQCIGHIPCIKYIPCKQTFDNWVCWIFDRVLVPDPEPKPNFVRYSEFNSIQTDLY
jgi:hypothetical protein